jgi:hypothetical protein
MNELFRRGARAGGYAGNVPTFPGELQALQALVGRSRAGDVAAVMSHVERSDIFSWLTSEGFGPVSVDRLRELLPG